MAALFDDVAVFHDQDDVCVFDGGETMGDDEAGASFHQVVHGFLDAEFGSGVYRAGCFIQNHDGAVC